MIADADVGRWEIPAICGIALVCAAAYAAFMVWTDDKRKAREAAATQDLCRHGLTPAEAQRWVKS